MIDGLRKSDYCGGFSEIAKGFWMRREDVDVKKLVEYALMLDIDAVYRRQAICLSCSRQKRPDNWNYFTENSPL